MSRSPEVVNALPESPPRRRLLALTPQPPSPTRQGAAIRNWNLLTQLATHYDVDLLTFGTPGDAASPRRGQGRPGEPWQGVITVPPPPRSWARRLEFLLFSRQPDLADRLWSSEFAQQLGGLLTRARYDVVQVEGLELARYLHLIARHLPPEVRPLLIFDDHNAEYVLQRRAARTDLGRPRGWLKGWYSLVQQGRLQRFERRAMRAADLTICVSDADAAALQPLAPERPLLVAPNGVDTAYYAPEGLPRERPRFDIIFSGTLDYRPNTDAALWFADAVWPVLKAAEDPRRERPLRLALVGRNPPTEVTRLVQRPGITVTGSVADDRPYFAGATIYVLPMRYGGGSRLKLLNALAMGCAVVSTAAGVEGTEVRHEEHLLIADSAEDFAAAVTRLLHDDALRQRLGAAGRAFVRERYDWGGIAARIVAGYEAAIALRDAPAAVTPVPMPPTEPDPEAIATPELEANPQ